MVYKTERITNHSRGCSVTLSSEYNSGGEYPLYTAENNTNDTRSRNAWNRTVINNEYMQDLKEEYEELRQCFLLLCPFVPHMDTAREVTTGVISLLESSSGLKQKLVLLNNRKNKEIKKHVNECSKLKTELEPLKKKQKTG